MDLEVIVQEVPESYIPIFIDMMELDTMEQIVAYRKKQSLDDQRRVDTLVKLVSLEAINENVNQMTSYPEAENLLKKIMKGG